MKKFIPVLIVITFIAVSLVYINSRRKQDADHITVSGNIEVTETSLSFQVSGELLKRAVDEGEIAKKDNILAQLDTKELALNVKMREAEVRNAESILSELQAGTRPEKVAQAAAQVRQAQAKVRELKHGSRKQEIAQAEANLNAAKADLSRVDADLRLKQLEVERQQKLYEQGAISKQVLDNVTTALEVSQSTREAANQKVQSAEQMLALVQEGPRSEIIDQAQSSLNFASAAYREAINGPRPQTIEQALARLDLSKQALALAQTQLDRAQIIAPFDGMVLNKSAEVGEFVRAGAPVLSIGNLENVYMRAYINEPDLGKVRLGQSVVITNDSFKEKKYNGSISFISSEAEFTPKSIQTSEERTRLVYRIKIVIPNPNMELKPGMPVDGIIRFGG